MRRLGGGLACGQQLGERTLIEHWNGASWTVVPSRHPGTFSRLEAVRAFSPTSIWAVGEFDRGSSPGLTKQTLILRYNGTRWTKVRSPSPGRDNSLGGVRWVSAKDAWAVGSQLNGKLDKTLILRWNGSRWRQVRGLNPAPDDALSAVAATSRKDVWAVGTVSAGGVADPFRGPRATAHAAGGQHTLILHWNGTAWKRAPRGRLGKAKALGCGGTSCPSLS